MPGCNSEHEPRLSIPRRMYVALSERGVVISEKMCTRLWALERRARNLPDGVWLILNLRQSPFVN